MTNLLKIFPEMAVFLETAEEIFAALPNALQNDNCIQDALARVREYPSEKTLSGLKSWIASAEVRQ